MTDEKKVQPMTLDDLIDGLDNLRIEGVNSAYDYVDYVRDNRPALEAEMRGTLRFKRNAATGEYWLLSTYGQFTSYHQPCEENCIGFAESLGLTAEFVEEESDEY